jgi:hypothetical protein
MSRNEMQQRKQHTGRGLFVLGLEDHGAGRPAAKLVLGLRELKMRLSRDREYAFRRDQAFHSVQRLFKQGPRAGETHVLLGKRIAPDAIDERPEPLAGTSREHDRAPNRLAHTSP